jgi:hypothetical protein
MQIKLLDGALLLQISLEPADIEYDDNICLCFEEPCHEDERVFKADQTCLYLKAAEARKLAKALLDAAQESDLFSKDSV